MSEHTPPLRYTMYGHIRDADDNHVATLEVPFREDAEFIVRACNSRDALLAALEELCGAVTIYAANSQQERDKKEVAVTIAWEQARAVIAKAKNTQTGQGIRPASD